MAAGVDPRSGAPAARRTQVVVIEDDGVLLALLAEAVSDEGCEVRPCATGREALGVLVGARPDVILLDWRLPDMDGGEFARLYRASAPDPAPLVLVSGLTGLHRLAAEGEMRPAAVLPKPFELDALFAVLRRFTDCLN